MDKQTDKLSFEDSLALLEESAEKLKSGQLSLEESVDVYRKSLQYYENCAQILKDAKQKIEVYRPETGKTEEL